MSIRVTSKHQVFKNSGRQSRRSTRAKIDADKARRSIWARLDARHGRGLTLDARKVRRSTWARLDARHAHRHRGRGELSLEKVPSDLQPAEGGRGPTLDARKPDADKARRSTAWHSTARRGQGRSCEGSTGSPSRVTARRGARSSISTRSLMRSTARPCSISSTPCLAYNLHCRPCRQCLSSHAGAGDCANTSLGIASLPVVRLL